LNLLPRHRQSLRVLQCDMFYCACHSDHRVCSKPLVSKSQSYRGLLRVTYAFSKFGSMFCGPGSGYGSPRGPSLFGSCGRDILVTGAGPLFNDLANSTIIFCCNVDIWTHCCWSHMLGRWRLILSYVLSLAEAKRKQGTVFGCMYSYYLNTNNI
jgi:hypothetical protein